MIGAESRDSLSAEKMQLFAAGLANLPPQEVRKAKVLYVRNAIAEYRAARESMKAFGCVQVFFALIPLFWPILILQRRQMRIGFELQREKIRNAIDVWKEDLAGENIDFE
jgi:hypothetical protein